MSRKTSASVRVDPNLRALKIYPGPETKKQVSELQSVGLRLSRDQAIHLARLLLAMAQNHEVIDITGYRFEQRTNDQSYKVTVTSMAK